MTGKHAAGIGSRPLVCHCGEATADAAITKQFHYKPCAN